MFTMYVQSWKNILIKEYSTVVYKSISDRKPQTLDLERCTTIRVWCV
uniref:Uncharacterized protein n=1 Tax=Anguilla anguilla TaxID=7936 RepID=A0A0E9P7P7_ANGAN